MAARLNPISGLLNIDKPKDMTSHEVVATVRKLAGQRKVGHAGTLDPRATGVLLVCLGQATRLVEYLMAGRKQYRATVRFGIETDTLDDEGQVVERSDPSDLTEAHLKAILPRFTGEVEQVPPIFSALKQGGKPLYKRARAGQEVVVEARPVVIYSLGWIAWQPPDLILDVTCAPGTYIRALARDLGRAAGSVAHLAGLVRTASGSWSLTEAVTLEKLKQEVRADKSALYKYLFPPDRAVSHLPQVNLDEETATRVRQGQPVEVEPDRFLNNHETAVAYTPGGELLAILTRSQADDTLWRPKKVFQTG